MPTVQSQEEVGVGTCGRVPGFGCQHAESFLDVGNRPWFENGADHALANPDIIPPGLDGRCRPVAIDGPDVEAERRRLDALF